MRTYKERLSEYVETIFRKYSNPGLHICDIATGGGKSYTIGKLTCEYYPQHFDRIVILCVQNKLVEGMNREIEQFVNTKHSLIKSTDILIIEKNADVIKKAIENGSFQELIDQLEYNIGALPNNNVRDLTYGCNRIKKTFEGVKNLICTQGNNNNELISNQITEAEFRLRNDVRNFLKYIKNTLSRRKIKRILTSTIY